jgi:hypothetical protein
LLITDAWSELSDDVKLRLILYRKLYKTSCVDMKDLPRLKEIWNCKYGSFANSTSSHDISFDTQSFRFNALDNNWSIKKKVIGNWKHGQSGTVLS